MLWSFKNLLEYTILTTDGMREPIVSALFDGALWELRYLIVKPEGFSPTPVMIALTAMRSPNQVARALPTELTAQQVKNSPTIVMNMLMTPSTQKRLNECYALYQYWALSGYASSSLPLALLSGPETQQPETTTFRDTHGLLAMTITAIDGDIGMVDDVIADDETWAIRYLIINGNPSEGDKTAWIPLELVNSVNWEAQHITIDVSCNHVKTSLTAQPQGEQL